MDDSFLNDIMSDFLQDVSNVGDKRKHILVVDDNAQTLRNLKNVLEKDYRVTLANSGIKAITCIGKDRPDLVLLDYEMPVYNGKQTFEMIQADEDIANIPVVFLTGVNDREHIKEVLLLKPAGYLLKPTPKEKLINTIEAAIKSTGEING